MSAFVKKQGAAFWFNCIASIAGIVGIVALVVSSNIDAAYAYKGIMKMLCIGIAGVALSITAIAAPNKFGNHDILSTASVIAGVALYVSLIGNMITERILLISGLFSWNSQNTVGWSVFRATVVAIAAILVASLALIIGAFMKSVEEN